MTQLTPTILAVQVPDDAENIHIHNYGLDDVLEYDYSIQEGRRLRALAEIIDLPPGNWHFLFTTKEATEEDARKVVENIGVWFDLFPNYVDDDRPVSAAIESMPTLLQSKGCDPALNYAIIEKE